MHRQRTTHRSGNAFGAIRAALLGRVERGRRAGWGSVAVEPRPGARCLRLGAGNRCARRRRGGAAAAAAAAAPAPAAGDGRGAGAAPRSSAPHPQRDWAPRHRTGSHPRSPRAFRQPQPRAAPGSVRPPPSGSPTGGRGLRPPACCGPADVHRSPGGDDARGVVAGRRRTRGVVARPCCRGAGGQCAPGSDCSSGVPRAVRCSGSPLAGRPGSPAGTSTDRPQRRTPGATGLTPRSGAAQAPRPDRDPDIPPRAERLLTSSRPRPAALPVCP